MELTSGVKIRMIMPMKVASVSEIMGDKNTSGRFSRWLGFWEYICARIIRSTFRQFIEKKNKNLIVLQR